MSAALLTFMAYNCLSDTTNLVPFDLHDVGQCALTMVILFLQGITVL